MKAQARIGKAAAYAINLDDRFMWLDVERVSWGKQWLVVRGTFKAIRDMRNELWDRATEGGDGYDHDPGTRRACRAAAHRLSPLVEAMAVAESHAAADQACGREWQCACAACRTVRG